MPSLHLFLAQSQGLLQQEMSCEVYGVYGVLIALWQWQAFPSATRLLWHILVGSVLNLRAKTSFLPSARLLQTSPLRAGEMGEIRDRIPAEHKKDRSHLCFVPATSWKKREYGVPFWHHRPASPQSMLFSAPQRSETWTGNTTQSRGIFHRHCFTRCFGPCRKDVSDLGQAGMEQIGAELWFSENSSLLWFCLMIQDRDNEDTSTPLPPEAFQLVQTLTHIKLIDKLLHFNFFS